MRKFLLFTFLIICAVVSANGLEYYLSAMNAYNKGMYAQALDWFEKAIQLDPKIESIDPLVKLRMGICAFAVRDYQKAKAYLSPYKDKDVVTTRILQMIDQGEPLTDEWLTWLRSRLPSTSFEPRTTTKKSVPILLLIGIFISTFSATLMLILFVNKLRARRLSIEKEIPVEEQLETQLNEVKQLLEEAGQTSASSKALTSQDLEDLEKLEQELSKLVEEVLKESSTKTEEKVTLISEENPYEILKKLEEKQTYSDEDAELISKTLEKIISNQEERSQS
ncbi:tetratricopeptide repeat protein [Pseudothermotoga thermarum]|uniref:TPR repeat-containing protein n=1 Tax=Pseudothermotoga thermarum DSM 5069 TaxID=688269 RepID=F7YVW6_9THEM|nr:tetratricopeptide repeat protein [Pseudothermotoga thermarum]AEH51788.1 TPR repeat-containing protein [Pseudothermotoga thermarum DSM 5069]